MHHDPPNPGPPQLQQHARRGRGELRVDQERQGGEELAQTADPVGSGRRAAQKRVHNGHLYRLRANAFHGFGPGGHGLPDEPFGVE